MLKPLAVPNDNITPRWPNVLPLLAGTVSFALGLMVLIGWYTNNKVLLQVLPGFVAMAYNTALGFFLSGAGLLILGTRSIQAFRKSLISTLLGIVVATLGLLTLVQYAFGVDLGIDQLLMTDYTFGQNAGQTSQFAPGRMAINTAICFTLTGFAITIMAVRPKWLRQRALTVGVLGSLVIAFAAVPFFGYLTGVAGAYGWGALTRMAVHTAVGFMVVGTGIVALAWREERAGKRGAPSWLPVLVGMGTLIATLLLWQALVSEQRTNTQRIVTSETSVIKNQIADRMGFRILVLARLAARWNIYGTPTKEKWESDARLLVDPGTVNRAVQWADPSFYVRWIASADGNRADQDRDLGADPQIRTALETARDQRKTVVTGGVSLADGSKGVLVTVPTFQGDRFDGFVIGLFETELLFNTLIGDEIARGYSIAVQSGGDEIYGNHGGNKEYYEELREEAEVGLPGTTWRIEVWPKSGLVAESESPFPWVVLIAGMTMAVLLALAMYLAQAARLRTRQVEATNLALGREITERQRVEADRDRLFSTSLDMVGIAGFDGFFKDVNPAFTEVLGFSSAEVCAKPFLDFVHPDDRAATLFEMEKLSTGALTLNFQNRYLCKDGTYKWIDWKAVPIVEEGLIYAVGRDMTERHQSEQALRASEERFRSVTQSVHDAIISADSSGTVIFWNKGAGTIFGYEEHEILGQSLTVLMPERYREAHTAEMHRVNTTDETHVIGKTVELHGLRKDGTEFPLELSLSNWETDEGTFYTWIARDVTERMQKDAELKRRGAQLAEAQKTAHMGSWEWDMTTGKVSWSDELYRIYGFEPGQFEPTYEAYLNIVHPDERDRVNQAISAALQEVGTLRQEHRAIRPDGSEWICHVQGRVIADGNGRPITMVGIAQDITERKRTEEEIKELNRDLERRVNERTAQLQTTNQELEEEISQRKRTEEALRESEEHFRLLVGGVKDYAILMLDPKGKITSWNEGAKRIKGYEADEIIGKHFSTFYPAEDIEARKPEYELEVAAAVGRFEDEGWRVRKDGSRFWTNVVITAVRDEQGRLRGFSKVSRDITERKLAAERTAFLAQASTALASSLDYEDTLTRVARIAVPEIADWCIVDIVDEDGQVQRVTMAHADPEKEEMGRDYLRRFPPVPNSDTGVSLVLRTLEPILVPEIDEKMIEASIRDQEQFELIRKLRPTSAMIVPLVAHGHAVGAISLLTAESGRRYGSEDLVLAEEVARRAATAVDNARLYRQAGKARTEAEAIGEELKKIVTELERSNTELQQFAYVASHDLQEPLRMVASYTQLLSRRYAGKLDEAADEFIAYAVDGATRMQRLINDLLAYSRVSTQGKEFERTDCEAVLKQALANLRMALRESNAEVTHDPLPTIMGDDTQLVQLFQNLIGNAIKFRGEEPASVHVGVERKESEWLFCVRDNGIGMDPQYADRIFVIFQRLHSKEEYPGTGIGLSVCKKVVERHGGRIWVESQPGEGSTFYFTMPVNVV